jgi:hypothetical protein
VINDNAAEFRPINKDMGLVITSVGTRQCPVGDWKE